MDNLLRYDNKFFEVLEKITNIVILNILCIISSLPIITIGASITTTYSIAMKMVKDKDTYIVKDYIKIFKENLKTSTIAWSIMTIIGGVIVFDLYISTLISHKLISNILQLLFIMISIVYIFTITYLFPIIAKFENTIKNTLINSTLISMQNLPYTIIIVILNLIPLLLISILPSYWGEIIFFYTVMGFGITAYINSIFFEKIFIKFIN